MIITKQMQELIKTKLYKNDEGRNCIALGNCRLDFSQKYFFNGFTHKTVKLSWQNGTHEINVQGKCSPGNESNGVNYFRLYTEGYSYSERFNFPTKEQYKKMLEATKMKKESKKEKASETVSAAEIKKKAEDKTTKVERKTMTIGETKLGITMVISKEDCKKLGFKESQTTKEAIVEIKEKLGIA
jgi:hypothetical protein